MSTFRKALIAVSLIALAVSAVHAASVVALVDSPEPFLIGGKRVSAAGIGNWPAFRGDRIATLDGQALVSFRDGSRVLLDKGSEILLSEKNGAASVKVLKGKLAYKLGDLSTLAFDNVAKTARAGTLALQNGSVSVLADMGFFVQLDRHAAPAPGTYPIQINWDSVPTGVTTTPGPLPVSEYRGH